MKRNIIAIAILLGLFGCNSENKNASTDIASAEAAFADSTMVQHIIKTADMRFRVRNVQDTKQQLSKAISAQGGTVAEFSIESIVGETDKVKISTDSVKEITSYRTEGYLVAKIPSEKLDEFTNTLAKMAVFVHTQSMKMDDQSINYVANTIRVRNKTEAAVAIKEIPSKKTNNIERSLALKNDALEHEVNNAYIDSKVKFSTVTLNFYQDNAVSTLMVANDNLYDYRPGFGNRFWLSLVNGWTIFKEMILALTNLWMLILAGVATFLIIRHFVRKNKLSAHT